MIKSAVGKVVDLSEKYPDKCNYWLDDPYHYLPGIGNRMIADNILGGIKE